MPAATVDSQSRLQLIERSRELDSRARECHAGGSWIAACAMAAVSLKCALVAALTHEADPCIRGVWPQADLASWDLETLVLLAARSGLLTYGASGPKREAPVDPALAAAVNRLRVLDEVVLPGGPVRDAPSDLFADALGWQAAFSAFVGATSELMTVLSSA